MTLVIVCLSDDTLNLIKILVAIDGFNLSIYFCSSTIDLHIVFSIFHSKYYTAGMVGFVSTKLQAYT